MIKCEWVKWPLTLSLGISYYTSYDLIQTKYRELNNVKVTRTISITVWTTIFRISHEHVRCLFSDER